MDGMRIDASILVAMTTIAIALIGLFFQGMKLSGDRLKDREERAGQMARTDAKLDELMRADGRDGRAHGHDDRRADAHRGAGKRPRAKDQRDRDRP